MAKAVQLVNTTTVSHFCAICEYYEAYTYITVCTNVNLWKTSHTACKENACPLILGLLLYFCAVTEAFAPHLTLFSLSVAPQ